MNDDTLSAYQVWVNTSHGPTNMVKLHRTFIAELMCGRQKMLFHLGIKQSNELVVLLNHSNGIPGLTEDKL